jgi:hypothetical protein
VGEDLGVPGRDDAPAFPLERLSDDRGSAAPGAGADDLVNKLDQFIGETNRNLPAHPKMIPNRYRVSRFMSVSGGEPQPRDTAVTSSRPTVDSRRMGPISPKRLRIGAWGRRPAGVLAALALAALTACGGGAHRLAARPRTMPNLVGERLSAARAKLKADGVAVRGFSVTRSSNGTGAPGPDLSEAIVCATRPHPGEQASRSVYLVAADGC